MLKDLLSFPQCKLHANYLSLFRLLTLLAAYVA